MNHVSVKWLRLIRWALILYVTHFVLGYLFFVYVRDASWSSAEPFSLVLMGLVAITFAYEIIASFSLKKRNPWLSTVITYVLALLSTFLILESTGVYTSPYVAVIVGLVFLGEALGEFISPSIVVVMIIGFLLGLAGFFENNEGGTLGGLLTLAAVTISTIFSYFYWRKRYEIQENPEVNKLNTMFKSRQQQSEVLLRSLADGVIATDTKGKINLINPAAADLIGWASEEAVNLDVKSVVKLTNIDGSPLDNRKFPFSESISAKQAVKTTLQLIAKDGRKRIISLVVSPVVLPPNYEVLGTVGIMRDISRQHQEEMQRAEFISTASHEMRTPVAAIEGYLALAMNDRVSKIDTKAREYLEKAHSSTQHLGKLFQDLLTSAKAEDGRLNYRPVAVEMGQFLDQATGDLKFAAQKKGLQTRFLLGSSETGTTDANSKIIKPLYYVQADPDRLREVITNLFDNAVKYTDAGVVTVGLTGNAEVVQFFIRDTGAGIPPDDISHLFQKFYRVNNTLTRAEGGTGLGLFISRKVIEMSNGRIWVESELGKGSTFYINLPRISAQKAAEIQAAQPVQILTPSSDVDSQ